MDKKLMNTIVETKACKHCASDFDITQGDLDFYKKISPKFGDYIAEIPTPTLCPDCRQRRRLAFRNERKLYRRICDATKQPIISIYKPGGVYKVYDQKIRRGDSRDPMDYGRNFDFEKNFTEQFGELMKEVPRLSIINNNGVGSINSEYTNDCVNTKNCYMCFEMGDCEDCFYSHHSNGSKDCIDCDEATDCINCYEIKDSINCYECSYSIGLHTSNNCHLSSFSQGCDHCLLCSGLKNQSYKYMNKSVSKEDFKKLLLQLQSDKNFRDKEIEVYQKDIYVPRLSNIILNSEGCTGVNIINSSYLISCRNSSKSENVKFGLSLYMVKDSMDIQCWKSEMCYEGQTLDESFGSAFCSRSSKITKSFYCDNVHNSSHCFGCIGLRNKSYCIFNKQYTKEEYNELVPKIVEHMKKPHPQPLSQKDRVVPERGEFFHPSLSPFGYNETVAQEYFPMEVSEDKKNLSKPLLTGKELQGDYSRFGYHWSEYKAPTPQSDKVIEGKDLPNIGCADIEKQKPEYLKNILSYAIRGEVTGKLFRLQPQEIQFYKKHNIPLPKKHPDQRHAERLALRI